jgi:tetratricopeptide (TPR) repeat protein
MLVILNIISLGSRVAEQMMPPAAEARLLAYASLDKVRNRNARVVFEEYLKENGRNEEADSVRVQWKAEFPEERMVDDALALMNRQFYQLAADTLQAVLERNPVYWNAWTILGTCYQLMHDNDSALFCMLIADGLNPYNHFIYNNLAHTYLSMGNHDKAYEYWRKSLARDSLFLPAITGLDKLELNRGTAKRPCDHLLTAASDPQASVEIIQALGDCYISYQDYEKARKVYDIGLERGMDSTHLDEVEKRFPQFKRR